ncbi:MAG: HD domain-containing protein [Dehalococcoidia bacterium]|nr:HD domain-containing protein [Dehalococcoidia bacterium]
MTPRAELFQALQAPSAAGGLRDLDQRGRLTAILPELEAGRGFAQPEKHEYTVLDHNLAAVEAIEAATGTGKAGVELRTALSWMDVEEALGRTIEGVGLPALLRLAALLHDVAKPETATTVDGALRFPRHGPRGAEMVAERLPALGLGPGATAFVAAMVRYHLRPNELIRQWPPSDRAVRKFATDLNGHVLPLMLVNLADGMATRGPRYTRENYRIHCGIVNYITARAWAVMEEDDPPLITGDDLVEELDLESGRLLGAVLTSVRRAQQAGALPDRQAALALARATLASLRAGRA